jgi:amidase
VGDDLAGLDATGQRDLVRTGQCQPIDLVEAAIERIERTNPRLNAFIHPLFEKARAEATSPDLPAGPLTGVPMALKDAVAHSAGDPYHVGMRFLRDLEWTEPDDAEIVRRFRRAGLVIVGKTNTPELAMSDTTEPEAYGPTRNPWDTAHSPGGSSGGSAAAVASGMVPVGHGNDMGGSIRLPASACGLVGLKPTRARSTLAPKFGEFWGPTTHEGVLTRTVRDTAAMLDVIAGPAPGDPYAAPPPARAYTAEVGADPGRLRVGLRSDLPNRGGAPHSECTAAVARAGALLESLGHDVDSTWPDAIDEPLHEALVLYPVFLARELERWSELAGRPIREEDVEPNTWMMGEIGRAATATQYLAALERAQAWSRQAAAWWADGWDLLVTPTMPAPPRLIGEHRPVDDHTVAFVLPWNLTGQPAVSLPLHWSADGLPIGVQLVAAQGREDLLIRVAAQVETAAPWCDRWPPVNALASDPSA